MAIVGARAQAEPPPLHELAPVVRAFASDGSRYVAWQTSEGSSIVVLDTATGQRRSLPPAAGCQLQPAESQAQGQALPSSGPGRFLLRCGTVEQGVLDVRTGQTQLLPDDLSRYRWSVVGTDYAESPNTGCGGYDKCFALYDLATGAISVRRAPAVVNLDRPGAPATSLCPSLRRRILAAERAVVPPSFAYESGLFVHAAKRKGYVEIDRCKRPPIMLSGRGEPRGFQLSGGVLSWDTGYPPSGAGGERETGRSSTVSAYWPASGSRLAWRLPARKLLGGGPSPVVFGYSAHTQHAIFWAADRSVNHGETGGLITETAAIYSARIGRG
ncbi:MAG TPA: hypothetical protein VKV16_08750 [Solirubrobacteraceae bacterium]|nr:hypothetical protein [Solirubrobacteraceae bacterium]